MGQGMLVTPVSSWSTTRNFRIRNNGDLTPQLSEEIREEQIEEVESRGRAFWLLRCSGFFRFVEEVQT